MNPRTWKQLLTTPGFLLGAGLFAFCAAWAVLYPWMSAVDPFARSGPPFAAPGGAYWLGTNDQGQDMLARLSYGLRASLWVGLLAGCIATAAGTAIGLWAGYLGGWIDDFLSSLTNLFLVIPSLVILILVSQGLEQRSLELVAGIIGITTWTWTARAVRAQAASLRHREHVDLARLNGFGTAGILWMHILPYLLSYVFMVFVLQMATGILSEAAISMLGLGPYDTVTLGMILNGAQSGEALVNGNWWVFLPAAGLVTALAFSLFVTNTAMEKVFNPRLRR